MNNTTIYFIRCDTNTKSKFIDLVNRSWIDISHIITYNYFIFRILPALSRLFTYVYTSWCTCMSASLLVGKWKIQGFPPNGAWFCQLLLLNIHVIGAALSPISMSGSLSSKFYCLILKLESQLIFMPYILFILLLLSGSFVVLTTKLIHNTLLFLWFN